MDVTAAIPWYGSNRTNAHVPGRLVGKLDWLGITCVGGACELPHFNARTVMAADVHRHLINYLNVVADPALNRELRRRVRKLPFAEETLADAQGHCRDMERFFTKGEEGLFGSPGADAARGDWFPDLDWAVDFFVTAWMGRSANSGTDGEFDGGLPVRWNASGGDSVVRYQSAWRTLRAWGRALQGTQFVRMDFFEFIARALVADRKEGEKRAAGKKPERRCLYVDLPWPDAGGTYVHKFTDQMQRLAAVELAKFEHTAVIVRFGDHSLIRDIYPEGPANAELASGEWRWYRLAGRNQGNKKVNEVLILNRPAAVAAAKGVA
jgi:hypothetical protein